MIQFLASLAILQQDENRLICTIFFNLSWCKSAYSSTRPGANQPILQLVLVQISQYFNSSMLAYSYASSCLRFNYVCTLHFLQIENAVVCLFICTLFTVFACIHTYLMLYSVHIFLDTLLRIFCSDQPKEINRENCFLYCLAHLF